MSNIFARFVKDESGATAIEYGLIAALIALAIMVGAGLVGNALDDKFMDIATGLNNANRDLGGGDASLKRGLGKGRSVWSGLFAFIAENPRVSFHRRLTPLPYDCA